MVLWLICSILFWPVLFFFCFFLTVFLGFTYLFTTSLPDLFVVTVTVLLTVGIIAGLTGGTFNFEKLGKSAWLEPELTPEEKEA